MTQNLSLNSEESVKRLSTEYTSRADTPARGAHTGDTACLYEAFHCACSHFGLSVKTNSVIKSDN